MTTQFQIRVATPADADFIQRLGPRFTESGQCPWRDPARIADFQAQGIAKVLQQLTAPTADQTILIATNSAGTPLGFTHLHTERSFLTDEEQGYVSMLAVTTEAEGSGVGKALLAAADDWARQRGYRHLALDTFGDNTHARAVYQRLGYQEESVRMVRLLD